MQSTSDLYKSILSSDNHWFVSRVRIAGVYYYEDTIISMNTKNDVFNRTMPVVGCAVAGEIDLVMKNPSVTIPKMAEVRPQVCVTDGERTSEWLPKGTFYIDTREITHNSDGNDILTIHGYDSMLKFESDYPSDNIHDYPILDYAMVVHIASSIELSVDARTKTRMDKGYQFPLPLGYSKREMLGFIAGSYGGNFVITDKNELLLIRLSDLPPETNYLITERAEAITFGGDRIKV